MLGTWSQQEELPTYLTLVFISRCQKEMGKKDIA